MEYSNQYTILAVDDAKDSLMLLEFDLNESGYQVITAESGEAALTVLKDIEVNLVLLDLYMPGISGLQTLQAIKEDSSLEHIPVIMLSASGNEEPIVAALELGADDYVTKPYLLNVLLARMKNSLRLMEKTLELESLAKIDHLTRVNNRGSFEEQTNKMIHQANREGRSVSIAMFDLDFFKQVNDNHGHEIGDKALIDFASILTDTFREYDVIGRVGGEEFAVCLPHTSIEDAFRACERCRKSLANHIIYIPDHEQEHQLSLTVSIGLTADSSPDMDFDQMLRLADQGLYQAKETGRNKTIIVNKPDDDNTDEYTIENKINEDEERDIMPSSDTTSPEESKDDGPFPGIDYSLGVKNVLGDDDLFNEILVMFHQDHGRDDKNIQQAITENDQKQLKHLVHTLKGVSCSVGAMTLFEYCKVLDVAVNEHNEAQYQILFNPVGQELVKVMTGVASRLADKL